MMWYVVILLAVILVFVIFVFIAINGGMQHELDDCKKEVEEWRNRYLRLRNDNQLMVNKLKEEAKSIRDEYENFRDAARVTVIDLNSKLEESSKKSPKELDNDLANSLIDNYLKKKK